jgi:hypothetical protein
VDQEGMQHGCDRVCCCIYSSLRVRCCEGDCHASVLAGWLKELHDLQLHSKDWTPEDIMARRGFGPSVSRFASCHIRVSACPIHHMIMWASETIVDDTFT